MRGFIPVVIFIALTVSAPSFAAASEVDTVSFGPVRVAHGMSEADVLPALREHFRLSSSGNTWAVLTKQGPPFDLLGTLSFNEHGKVTEARRHSSSTSDVEALAFVKALTALLERHATADGTSLAIIHVPRTSRTPTLDVDTIRVLFADQLVPGDASSPVPAGHYRPTYRADSLEINIYETRAPAESREVRLEEVLSVQPSSK